MNKLTIGDRRINLINTDLPIEAGRMVESMVANGGDVAFDIETTGLSPRASKIAMLQFKQRGKVPFILDVRGAGREERAWLGSKLRPLFVGVRLLGMNLKFDLEFMLVQYGIALDGVHLYDVMLAEQVIRGMGTSSARAAGISFDMAGIAGRYGLPVSKQERNWFIDLDTRIEGQHTEIVDWEVEDGAEDETPVFGEVGGYHPWDMPFPDEQLLYGVQDVAILFDIYDHQQPLLKQYALEPTADLEMLVEPPTASMEAGGVLIRPDGWMKVINRAQREASRIEAILHYGDLADGAGIDDVRRCIADDNCFEGLDYHIIAARQEKYEDLLIPYEEWRIAREAFIESRRAEWDSVGNQFFPATEGHSPVKGWGEYKKLALAWYDERHEKPKKPTLDKTLPNIAAPAQIAAALKHIGLQVSGASKEELDRHAGEHRVIDLLLEFRDSNSIVVKFGQALLDKRDPISGRWHPSYEQIGADSGRMSSHGGKEEGNSGFNFQQIPSRGKYRDLRHHIIARPGHRLVLADFSNIELRILAELTQKHMGYSALLDAFKSGMDIHEATARMMFGLGKDVDVRSDAVINGKNVHISWRNIAKTINYGLSYGMGVQRLALTLKVDLPTAQELMKLYRETYNNETKFLRDLKSVVDNAIKTGKRRVKSRTLLGRIRWFAVPVKPTLLGKDKDSVHAFEEAMQDFNKEVSGVKLALANTPIQGTSADITKLAVAIWHERYGSDPHMHLLGVVHDELIVEAEICFVPAAEEKLAKVMDEAQRTFLKRVALPVPEVMHSKYWLH